MFSGLHSKRPKFIGRRRVLGLALSPSCRRLDAFGDCLPDVDLAPGAADKRGPRKFMGKKSVEDPTDGDVEVITKRK